MFNVSPSLTLLMFYVTWQSLKFDQKDRTFNNEEAV